MPIPPGEGAAEAAGRGWRRLIGPPASLRRGLVRGGVGSFAVKFATAAIGAGLAVVLARMLGPADYGIYAFAIGIVSLLSIPATMGLPTLVVRETARGEAAGEGGRIAGLWRWATRSVAAASAIAALTMVAVAANNPASPRASTLVLGSALIPLTALAALRGAALQGLHRVVLGQLPEMVVRPLLLLLGVAAALVLAPGSLGASGGMALAVAAAAASLTFATVLLYRCRPATVRDARPVYHTPAWVAALVPLALLGGVQVAIQQTGIVLLGFIRSDAEVGIFRVATQSAMLVAFGMQAVTWVVMPHAARMAAASDRRTLQKLATASARAGFAVAAVAFAGAVILGEWLLTVVFGEAYAAGYGALAIMAGGQLAFVAIGPAAVILNMSGNERATLLATAAAAAANVVLGLVLIPMYGLNGAAIATATTLALWNALLSRSVARRLGIDTSVVRPWAAHAKVKMLG